MSQLSTITLPDTDAEDAEALRVETELQAVQRAIGDARLARATGDPASAKVSLQIAFRRFGAVVGTLAVLLGFALTPASTEHAAAAVLPTVQPVKVVISGPTATMATIVYSTACTIAHGGHSVAISAPLAGRQTRVGWFGSATPLVKLSVPLPSRSYVLGRSTWMVRDIGDDNLRPLTVDARQASRFAQANIVAAMPGYVFVNARVQHYSAAAGTWVPSQASPVVLQAFSGRQWNTIATLRTDTFGYVYDTAMAVPGYAQYRLVRPAGNSVWSAVSAVTTVDAGPTFDY